MINTESDRYNLFWLENAMTLPVGYHEQHYYLDERTNNLFAYINIDENGRMAYVDRFYRELDAATANELAQRLSAEDHEMSQVFEIPRLTVDGKINLQLGFLATLPGGYHNSKLYTTIKQQPNDNSFVLDFALIDTHPALIVKRWEEYKLETLSRYTYQFIKLLNNASQQAVA